MLQIRNPAINMKRKHAEQLYLVAIKKRHMDTHERHMTNNE